MDVTKDVTSHQLKPLPTAGMRLTGPSCGLNDVSTKHTGACSWSKWSSNTQRCCASSLKLLQPNPSGHVLITHAKSEDFRVLRNVSL